MLSVVQERDYTSFMIHKASPSLNSPLKGATLLRYMEDEVAPIAETRGKGRPRIHGVTRASRPPFER